MYTTTDTARPGGIRNAFRRAEAWLDARGKWAWITAMVLGFIFVWPVGLALLAYMIWGKQMFSRSCTSRRTLDRDWASRGHRAAQGTGNHAFDTYKAEALRRLEDEQDAFEAFLQRLRNSKDKSEFDTFMDERARSASSAETPAPSETKSDATARSGEY